MKLRINIALAVSAALALAACGNSAEEEASASLEGEPIEAVDAPEGTSWLDVASANEDGGIVLGNPDAPLKLVEYASHTCAACAMFAETGSPNLKQNYVDTGVVSYEIRPLFLNPLDITIGALARCGRTESFHALSDQAWGALPQFNETLRGNAASFEAAMNGPPEDRFLQIAQAAGLIDFFAARGLSADQARSCLTDTDTITQMAERASTVSTEAQVTGTPTFFLNGQRLDANQWPGVEPALQRAGAR